MTEQEIREKFYNYIGSNDPYYPVDGAKDEILNFFLSIRTQEREELEKKIDGIINNKEDDGDSTTKGYNQGLLAVKTLLKEQ